MPLTDKQIRERLPSFLRAVAMADKTIYQHHEKRLRDGKMPEGGTIWLTPREMAISYLRALGEETASLYWPFRPPGAADESAHNDATKGGSRG